MKSIFAKIFFAACVLCAAQVFAQTQKAEINTNYDMPEFDAEGAFLIDATELKGKGCKKVTLVNYTDYRGITFEVYVHSPISQKWENLGKANLRAFADASDVGQKYANLNKMRYFAVVPSQKDLQNEYFFQATKKQTKLVTGAPLIVEVRRPSDPTYEEPKPILNEENAYVMGPSEVPEDVDENFFVSNMTSSPTISLRIYGYHKKDLRWIPLGTVAATQKKKYGKLIMDQYDFQDFFYYGFVPNSKKPFAYSFENKSDSLHITVSDVIE